MASWTHRELEPSHLLIDREQPWPLSVEPGLYLVSISDEAFVTPGGWIGQAVHHFGVLVDPARERAIVPAWPFHAECADTVTPSGAR